ncbi:hypothetical protein BX600DRAFT_518029 [Xylariales sp. PMI_506]|nr:hypothetical protein BX600DRAFT_518029 [Xylariales sp. PMI_506]
MAPKPPKPYFLLSEVATQDKINSLLGRAVPFTSSDPEDKNQPLKRPSEGYIFPLLPPEGPDLRKLDPLLYPQNVMAKEATTLLRSARGSDAEIAITKALALFHSSEKSNTREASIPGFRRLTIDQAPHRIRQLLKHREYADPILQYFTDFPSGKLGIIVSIICALDMSLNVEHSQSRETGAEFEVPSESLGLPPNTVDLKTKISASNLKVSEAEGTYVGEVVVACGYLQMTRKPESGLMSLFRSKKPTLDDIEIPGEFVHPRTMTVSLPATRITGDQEPILGDIDLGDEQQSQSPHDSGDCDSDEDIALYS